MSHDKTAQMASDEFDTQLWLLLCKRISSPEDMERLPVPVIHYWASRYLQWEVGNGGFAQAAYNIPHVFPAAADGYEALGKKSVAGLIREAMRLLSAERVDLERKGLFSGTIATVFKHFRESRMSTFDDKLDGLEWEIDEERVAYVRGHRDAFETMT